MGTPVLIGAHTYNFAAATQGAIEAGAALRVPDAAGVFDAAHALLSNPERLAAMGDQARAFWQSNQGATARTLDALAPLLAPGRNPKL